MKKLLLIALCLIMLFTFCACSSTQFLSKSQVNKLVKKYANDGKLPQVEMTLSYKTPKNSTSVQIKVVYDLLLDEAPISVISFINLLNDGRYDNVVVDSKTTTYMSIGRYTYTVEDSESSSDRTYAFADTSKTFIGEFKNNNFKPYGDAEGDDDGYAKFDFFSLAMYHDAATSKSDDKEQQTEYHRAYDSADGRLMLSLGETRLNTAPSYKEYAVFARPVSFSYSNDGGENFANPVSKFSSSWYSAFTGVTSKTVKINGTNYSPIQIDVSFKMVAGTIDWANITESYLVDAE